MHEFLGVSVEVVSLGCRLNLAESEKIRTLLAGESDSVVVNSCAVTSEAERDVRARRAIEEERQQWDGTRTRLEEALASSSSVTRELQERLEQQEHALGGERGDDVVQPVSVGGKHIGDVHVAIVPYLH